MRIENSLAMATVATFAPLHASAHMPYRFDLIPNVPHQVAAPFDTSPRFVIVESELQSLLFRQELLSPSSADDARISVSIAKNDTDVNSRSPAVLIQEFKRLSGITWAQVSKIFGVSTRAPFDWAAGKVVSEKNHKLLGQAAAVLRYIDRGTGEENKRLLLSEARSGKTFIDLLEDGQFDRVKELAGRGKGRISIDETVTSNARKFALPSDFGQTMEESAKSDLIEVVPLGESTVRKVKIHHKKA